MYTPTYYSPTRFKTCGGITPFLWGLPLALTLFLWGSHPIFVGEWRYKELIYKELWHG